MYKVSKKLYVFTLLDKVLFLVNCNIWYCTMQIVSAAGLLVPEESYNFYPKHVQRWNSGQETTD
jgi:hypothetical protein